MKQIINQILAARLATIILLVLLPYVSSFAQGRYGRHRSNKFSIGLETAVGTKFFNMKSDIEKYNGIKFDQEGFNVGLVAGFEGVQMKLVKGFYHASSLTETKTQINNFFGAFNIFPLHFTGSKNKFIRPYLIMGLDHSVMKVSTLSIVPIPPAPAPGGMLCNPDAEHTDDHVHEPASEPARTPLPEPTLISGDYKILRMATGAGIQVHITKKRYFVNFHLEVQYGIPLNTTATIPGFTHTTVDAQFAPNGGVAFGLRR